MLRCFFLLVAIAAGSLAAAQALAKTPKAASTDRYHDLVEADATRLFQNPVELRLSPQARTVGDAINTVLEIIGFTLAQPTYHAADFLFPRELAASQRNLSGTVAGVLRELAGTMWQVEIDPLRSTVAFTIATQYADVVEGSLELMRASGRGEVDFATVSDWVAPVQSSAIAIDVGPVKIRLNAGSLRDNLARILNDYNWELVDWESHVIRQGVPVDWQVRGNSEYVVPSLQHWLESLLTKRGLVATFYAPDRKVVVASKKL